MTQPPRDLRVLDLFAGAGGFSLGLKWSGVADSTIAVEIDAEAAETFALNFPSSTVLVRDVRDVSFSDIAVDLVVAGPPCQGFSALNKSRAGDIRNEFYREVLRAARETAAAVVILENVPQFLASPQGKDYVNSLKLLGYVVRTGVINCADFGVPQRRLRAIVSGARNGFPSPWPVPTHAEKPSSNLNAHRTVGEAIAFMCPPDGQNWHRPYAGRPDYERRVRAIPIGGSRRDLPPDLLLDCWKVARGFTDVMGRLHWHRPANTIRTEFFRPEKGRFIHPQEDRPITPREAARIQSFPDDFRFPEAHTLTSIGRQIGNAMPPLAACAIGRAVSQVVARDGISICTHR